MDEPQKKDRIFSVTLNTRQLKSACIQSVRRQAGNLAILRQMHRKPRLLLLWLATARKAQFTLVASVLALFLLAPSAADRLSGALYPSRFEEQGPFQRLFDTRTPVPNPLREARRDQFLIAAWIFGLGFFFVVLLDHAPLAVAIGRQRATDLLTEAERLAALDPEQSAQLKDMAHEYMIDELTRDIVAADNTRTIAASTQVIARPNSGAGSASFVGADGRYRLDKPVGSGGMGVVHAGLDTLLQRPVALKQLFSHLVRDAEQSARFRQEALALASLTHPHIVTIYDLVEFEGHFWIVMELLTGKSLADRIRSRGTIPAAESIGIACDIAAGLGYAHRRGIVHRDVKPMNILFTADGKPKLTDFGNAKLHEAAVYTQEGHLLGSPSYMSPEQIKGTPIDSRTDIYSLGITLYQMLTGTVPFEGELSSILAQHVTRKPDPPGARLAAGEIPPSLDRAVLKMLEKTPEERFQHCDEVITALREVSDFPAQRRRA